MDEIEIKESTRFPAGYGDFAPQCSDGIICHFPWHLLEYMSPVFRDMFSMPSETDIPWPSNKSTTFKPLKLSERSEVIELVLQHIDPKTKEPLPFQERNIMGLLEAARKYQITTITEWFISEAALPQRAVGPSGVTFTGSFLSTHPDLTLQCALAFDLPSIGSLALRELAGAETSKLFGAETGLQLQVYQLKHGLREQRLSHLRSCVWTLTDRIYRMDATGLEPCGTCHESRCEWLLRMDRAITSSPNWDTFSRAYEEQDGCTECGAESWPTYYRGLVGGFQETAELNEEALPAWPF